MSDSKLAEVLALVVERLDREATKGPWDYSPQNGKPGHCLVAQVWSPSGESLATIDSTQEPKEATANARYTAEARTLLPLLAKALSRAYETLDWIATTDEPYKDAPDDAAAAVDDLDAILAEALKEVGE